MKYPILILLIVQLGTAYSQSKKLSSFSRGYAHNSMLDSARRYVDVKPGVSLDFAVKALEFAIKEKNELDEAECYVVFGKINQSLEQYDLAVGNFEKALKIFEKNYEKQRSGEVRSLLAESYAEQNQLSKSEQLLQQNVADAEIQDDESLKRKSKSSLASVYMKKGEEEKAIKELEQIYSDTLNLSFSEQSTYNLQMMDAYSFSAPEKALEISEENERLAKELFDTTFLLNTLDKKADIYSNLGRKDEQLQTLQKSNTFRSRYKDSEGYVNTNLKISDVLIEQQKLDDAIAYLEESVELTKESSDFDIKKKTLNKLSKAYDISGNYNKALAVYRDYVDASEQSAKQREEKILENLKLMQSLNSRLQRVTMLESEKQLSDQKIALLEQEQDIAKKSLSQQRLIIVSLIAGLLILAVAVFLIQKSSRQKRIANQLLALRSLRSQMNPHFIFNALNSVNSYISKSDERSANKFLADFSKLMRAVMENSKHDFVPLSSEIEILELYLKLEHHRFQEKFDYTFTVDETIDADNVQIPPMLIQPYIENAIWHGLRYKETKGYLKVELSGGSQLKIVVEDNGIGRKKSLELKTKNQQQTVSTGMKNINNRIAILNSVHKMNLQVEVKDMIESEGTVVEIVVPVK